MASTQASVKAGLTDTKWVDLGGGPEVRGIKRCAVNEIPAPEINEIPKP